MNGLEDGRLERLREPRVHRPSLLPFTLDSLEVIKTTLSCDLALELLQPVEGHACSVSPVSVSDSEDQVLQGDSGDQTYS